MRGAVARVLAVPSKKTALDEASEIPVSETMYTGPVPSIAHIGFPASGSR